MNPPDELCTCDLDWLGCEAMFSIPAFGLPQPAEQAAAEQAAERAEPPRPEMH